MQEPVYVDLFATKGIEYLLVVGFLVSLILFWRLLNKPASNWSAVTAVARKMSSVGTGWFHLPTEKYYHPGHSWAQLSEDGTVTVGIDDFAQKLIGKPDSIRLPKVGARVEQGAQASRFEVDSKAIDLLSPVDGEVVDRNPAVLDSPDLINRDPYGEGWLMRIKPSRIKSNLKNLLHAKLAAAWMETTESELRQMMSGELGVVLQDGGIPITGIARNLSGDDWDELAKDFLLSR